MDDPTRLGLIVETVKYCQRVKSMGMPASCYTKALREPVYFLWELRSTAKKIEAVHYRSKAAAGLRFGSRELVRDHSVPFSYLQRELLALDTVTVDTVHEVLQKYGTACLITADEDRRLSASGLGRKMPADWDGTDALARYRVLEIEMVSLENSGGALDYYSPS